MSNDSCDSLIQTFSHAHNHISTADFIIVLLVFAGTVHSLPLNFHSPQTVAQRQPFHPPSGLPPKPSFTLPAIRGGRLRLRRSRACSCISKQLVTMRLRVEISATAPRSVCWPCWNAVLLAILGRGRMMMMMMTMTMMTMKMVLPHPAPHSLIVAQQLGACLRFQDLVQAQQYHFSDLCHFDCAMSNSVCLFCLRCKVA